MNTRRPMWLRSFVAILLSLALLGTACATQDEDEQEATGESNGPDTGVDTAASQLRSGLTSQLQEHVYLAGIAVNTGANAGLDSAEFEAAAGALDENSVALSEAITSVYGEDAGQQFLELWRKHIGFFVDYTEGKATDDARKAREAKRNLDGYREDFGAFLESANPNLPKEAVVEELQPHVQTLFAAIDAVVAGDASAFSKLREAAQVMPNTAKTLAGGIAAQMPDEYPGNVDGDAAGLRADLTHLLQEHVYLAGIAVDTGVSAGLDSAEFEAAAGALDENSVALSEAITSVYGEDAGQQFLEL
ncbi:MAG: copper amine oxidase, partial [Actinobacteria bacterium]|nr:copper amine oxidase [Actinomycetota bacterium]